MHPAPSVILFTVMSGMGFGCLAFLGLGLPAPEGWAAFFHWGLGYGLAVGGLLASTFHLGNPQRFLRAFSQWRTSWLSREAWASVGALLVLAPVALSDWLELGWPRGLGWLGAGLCVATVAATGMIYAQMASIPRWNSWTTPVQFGAFMVSGGAVVTGNAGFGLVASVALGMALVAAFRIGDTAFARAGQTIGTATGLGGIGEGAVFELPHTGQNYLMREMIHVVGRKHVRKLRRITILGAAVLPFALLLMPGSPALFGVIALVHLTGALAARWLFFAQAEHVVGLYYGQR